MRYFNPSDPVQVAFEPPSARRSDIHLLYSGLGNTERIKSYIEKGFRFLDDPVINGVIPITTLAFPTAIEIWMFNVCEKPYRRNTDLDFLPHGPKLHLAEGEPAKAFELCSLFLPDFGVTTIKLVQILPRTEIT